jgi:hypothetical protein
MLKVKDAYVLCNAKEKLFDVEMLWYHRYRVNLVRSHHFGEDTCSSLLLSEFAVRLNAEASLLVAECRCDASYRLRSCEGGGW